MNTTADAILAAIRACGTAAEIHAVADKHRADVMAMQKSDAARFHHIVNAKAYYLESLRNGI